jgi:hypothetical protein
MQIVKIVQDGPDGILVTFSDGTIAGYVAEELIELRPVREKVRPRPSAPRADCPIQPRGGALI